MILPYEEMLVRLKKSSEHIDLTYFTKEFYSLFVGAWRIKWWAPVWKTEFHRLAPSSYCHFLEEFNATIPEWKVYICYYDQGAVIPIKDIRLHAENEEQALAFAENGDITPTTKKIRTQMPGVRLYFRAEKL